MHGGTVKFGKVCVWLRFGVGKVMNLRFTAVRVMLL